MHCLQSPICPVLSRMFVHLPIALEAVQNAGQITLHVMARGRDQGPDDPCSTFLRGQALWPSTTADLRVVPSFLHPSLG